MRKYTNASWGPCLQFSIVPRSNVSDENLNQPLYLGPLQVDEKFDVFFVEPGLLSQHQGRELPEAGARQGAAHDEIKKERPLHAPGQTEGGGVE